MVETFMKAGKVVIVLAGRYAGKKAVIVKTFTGENQKARNFGHCLIAGIAKNPRPVTKSMSKAKIERRSKVKAFVKYINYQHIMATRYNVDTNDLDLKSIVLQDEVADDKKTMVKAVRDAFTKKYVDRTEKQKKSGEKDKKNAVGVSYFFQKLRF